MTTRSRPYRAIVLTPGVARGLAAGVAARLAAGMLPFAVVATVASEHGFSAAGIASAATLLVAAVTGPLRGRLADRYGNPALVGAALLYGTLATTAAVIVGAAPAWAVIAVLTAASGCGPPITAAIRTRWSRLLPEKNDLQRVHTLDSIVEELTFVTAPLVTTAVLVVLSGPVGIAVVGWIPLAAVALAVERGAGVRAGGGRPRGAAQRRRAPIAASAVGRGIVVPIAALGLVGGSLGVLLPASMAERGEISSAGYLLALFSAGGVVGGLVYARREWTVGLRRRYLAMSLCLAVTTAALAPALGTAVAPVGVFAVGLAMTPLFVIGYLLVDAHLPHRQTEANVWIGASYNVGAAAGAAGCGALLAQLGPGGAALLIASAAALAPLFVLGLPRTAPAGPPASSEPPG
ncbi:MFS transporter [Allonocardiopsis opalescens]|uniref:MFS family arabinose efflux permease n=1 Tax=Allonocardiopsis opalescens TaxID=1144618 RepID=A0A2T0QEQ3_9ACTN|nr:MFS transporter [Allonocardiopsis opalescens]PRY02424.1 hypothetical protein CLV72_1011026 [Allonocardiopsis opalescens]